MTLKKIMLSLLFFAAVPPASAGEMDTLLDRLVEKNIIGSSGFAVHDLGLF